MFDWEHGIALHAMLGIGPHLVERGKSHVFFRVVARCLGIFSSYGRDGHWKLVCSVKSGFLFSYDGHLRNLN